jgi:hypothetical protein
MNDRFSAQLRQHLLDTANERLSGDTLAAIVEGVAGTAQHHGVAARLTWFPRRMSLFPSAAMRYGLLVAALLIAMVAAALFVGGNAGLRTVFEGTWTSIDIPDGSTQFLVVGGGSNPKVHFEDRFATGAACQSDAVKVFMAEGSGQIFGARLDASFPNGGGCGSTTVEIELRLIHDAGTDSLRDQHNLRWFRVQDGDQQATPSPTTEPSLASEQPRSGSMWPQSTPDEVRAAQQRADAGDAEYTWQVDPGLMSAEWWAYVKAGGVGIVERFLRDELGWDQFLFNPFLPLEYTTEEGVLQVVYVRCAPGKTNTLYGVFPEGHNGAPGAESCAPTLDDLRYETVSLDIAQPGKQGPTGIWVVSRWTRTAPFAQTDPAIAEAQATARLREFLRARVAGEGAEGQVDLVGFGSTGEVPLLYATTKRAPFERFEFELVSGPEWPFAWMEFAVRLFADGGATVVEQPLRWADSTFSLRASETTENGDPVPVSYAFFDGLVTFAAADPWHVGFERFAMELGDQSSDAVIFVTDPRASGVGCGVSPAPVDADALGRSLRSDPDLEATAPAAVTIDGGDALQMDLAPAPGASVCDGATPVLRLSDASGQGSDRRSANLDPGSRMRLYLVDLPRGSASRVVAIAVVAPEARFDSVLEAATPIIDSIEIESGGN